MGDRGQVHIVDTDVWLYTHRGATNLPSTVRDALAREERWRDPEYLGRIIFQQMVDGDTSATGYGIGTERHGDVNRVVHVKCRKSEVRLTKSIRHYSDGEQTGAAAAGETYSFEEYVDTPTPEWPDPNRMK